MKKYYTAFASTTLEGLERPHKAFKENQVFNTVKYWVDFENSWEIDKTFTDESEAREEFAEMEWHKADYIFNQCSRYGNLLRYACTVYALFSQEDDETPQVIDYLAAPIPAAK